MPIKTNKSGSRLHYLMNLRKNQRLGSKKYNQDDSSMEPVRNIYSIYDEITKQKFERIMVDTFLLHRYINRHFEWDHVIGFSDVSDNEIWYDGDTIWINPFKIEINVKSTLLMIWKTLCRGYEMVKLIEDYHADLSLAIHLIQAETFPLFLEFKMRFHQIYTSEAIDDDHQSLDMSNKLDEIDRFDEDEFDDSSFESDWNDDDDDEDDRDEDDDEQLKEWSEIYINTITKTRDSLEVDELDDYDPDKDSNNNKRGFEP